MENKNPGILRNLRVKRVALVDVGANMDTLTGDGAHIMLFKRAEIKKDGPGVASVHVDSVDWRDDEKAAKRRKIEADNKNKEKSMKKSFLKGLLGVFAETDEVKKTAALTQLAKDAEDFDDDQTPVHKAHDADNPNCKCADCMEKAKAKRFEGSAEIAKAISDVEKKHAEEVAVLKTANTNLLASIEIEKNARLDAEMRDVLKSFKATPFDLNTDVAKFRKMKADMPETFDMVIKAMRATDAQLAQSELYKSVGSNARGGGNGDAWAQIEAKAAEMVSKSAAGLTREQAIEKVCFDPANKELVKQYRAGNTPSA